MTKAGDASASSDESTCSVEFNSITEEQMDYEGIFLQGDLNRVHLIDEYIAAANTKPGCSDLCENIAVPFCGFFYPCSDGALLHALTQ